MSLEQQIERLMKRNKLSLEEAQQRINSQMPLADKIAKATYIIDNIKTNKSYPWSFVTQIFHNG
jgi:dephospho-CoA kinase